jgi:hypothetical protein
MTRLSLAILGTAAILTSVLAGPAMAKSKMDKSTMDKSTMAKGEKDKQVTAAKTHRHMQHHGAYRGERFRNGNALVTRDEFGNPVGPVGAAGAIVGGAAAAAGEIATAPFRAFDSSYDNYYGYGYGRDWKSYAARNNLACTPGTTFRDADGRQRLCQ